MKIREKTVKKNGNDRLQMEEKEKKRRKRKMYRKTTKAKEKE